MANVKISELGAGGAVADADLFEGVQAGVNVQITGLQLKTYAATTTSPGGADTQVQFNDAGAFGGDAGMVFNKTTNLLTLTGTDGASSLLIASGSQTGASSPALSITQTWNNAATTFVGILENVTSTAAATQSQLMDLQVGGSTRFRVLSSGNVFVPSTGSFGIGASTGGAATLTSAGNGVGFNGGGVLRGVCGDPPGAGLNGFWVREAGMFGWSSTTSPTGTADTILSRNAAGVVQFGTTAANASGAWLAAKGTLTGGTLADQGSVLAITATQPATPSTTQVAIPITITGNGSAGQTPVAMDVTFAAGYTGTSSSISFGATNASAGTATANFVPAAGSNGSAGNFGFSGAANATTTGHNWGGRGIAQGGAKNVGVQGIAQVAKNSATNMGVMGTAINTGSTPVQIGGYFVLNQTTAPTVSAALIADNGSQTDPIFLARDNGTTTFTIADGGAVTNTSSETIMSGTAIPAGGTAGAGYKFSSTSNFGVFFGSGAPGLAAAKGSLYLRSDGSGVTDRAYINTDGGTTWTALTTAG